MKISNIKNKKKKVKKYSEMNINEKINYKSKLIPIVGFANTICKSFICKYLCGDIIQKEAVRATSSVYNIIIERKEIKLNNETIKLLGNNNGN